LRPVKGIDVLIDAIAQMHGHGQKVTATLVGDGPERGALQHQVEHHSLEAAVRFMPAMAARDAMTHGRIMVAPSRAESLPYVVLEAAAAGKPLITTRVGGIPEIYGPLSNTLVPPIDVLALAASIGEAIGRPDTMVENTRKLREQVLASFSVDSMVDGVLSSYQTALEILRRNGRR
jgi:glycosyltransferase involved in cell wall biosynthesis